MHKLKSPAHLISRAMAPEDLPDICKLAGMDPLLRRQVENDYGSVERQEARVKKALAETAPVKRRLGS